LARTKSVLTQRRVRQARTAAGLPSCITPDACRHGGMTELGDAELTEQGVMSLTRRRKRLASTSSAPSGSVRQCASSSAWVEANGLSTSVGMERQTKVAMNELGEIPQRVHGVRDRIELRIPMRLKLHCDLRRRMHNDWGVAAISTADRRDDPSKCCGSIRRLPVMA
jgi:hypothetical protein